jgi:hypothetical protein
MKAAIRDVRVGRPFPELPLKRFVTLTAVNAQPGEWGKDENVWVLDEEEARKLADWLGRCLRDLSASAVDISMLDGKGATLAIELPSPG